ncbi:MAG TPA: HD domain-containing phosphohydrolase [Longimicrobiales bacterium]|nr:HD domain-containing phosphohydrolase [Longimicrobiales bacterium]
MSNAKARWADARILIVDDVDSNVRLLSRLLDRAGYCDVCATSDAREALEAFGTFRPNIVLMDLRMPHLDGFALMQRMRELSSPHDVVPVLVITADSAPESRLRARLLGASDYLIKPYALEEVVLRVDALLELRAHAQEGFREIVRLQQALHGSLSPSDDDTEQGALRRLSAACTYWDSLSEGHTQRVGELAAQLAAELRLPGALVEALRQCAPLHDLGKSAIPEEILLKPGALTPEEMAMAQRHAAIGGLILSGSPFPLLRMAAEIALTHHERWDGSGYPRGLHGAEIPTAGRVVAVADVFDALTHERPYKSAWSEAAALTEIVAQREHHFDPTVVDALVRIVRRRSLSEIQAA